MKAAVQESSMPAVIKQHIEADEKKIKWKWLWSVFYAAMLVLWLILLLTIKQDNYIYTIVAGCMILYLTLYHLWKYFKLRRKIQTIKNKYGIKSQEEPDG